MAAHQPLNMSDSGSAMQSVLGLMSTAYVSRTVSASPLRRAPATSGNGHLVVCTTVVANLRAFGC
jgi:hypothetical protein